MTYEAEKIINFPDDPNREAAKIEAAFTDHTRAIESLADRIKALENPAPVPSPPNADVLWRWNATSVEPFFIHAKPPHSERVLFTHADDSNAVRLLTLPGDNNVNGSGEWERCDLRLSQELTDGFEGVESWWRHSVLFPDDYVQPPRSEQGGLWHGSLVFDFHNTADQGGQANFQVAVYPETAIDSDRPTGIQLQLHAGNPSSPMVVKADVQRGAVTRNKRYEFKYHVRWAADSSGFFRAWVDGVLHMDHKGPTLYTSEGVYLKLANYHSPFGKASAVLHGPIVRGATEAAVRT